MTNPILDKVLRIFGFRTNGSQLMRRFEQNRLKLQEDFFLTASTAGTPRGLRWKHCDWRPENVLLRDASTGEICLLNSVGISFEAVEGGDMEHVAAVSQLRDACAVFQYLNNRWQTSGRVLFNMDPGTAIERLGAGFEQIPA